MSGRRKGRSKTHTASMNSIGLQQKASLVFFHKGAIMKWLWVLLVVVPVSAWAQPPSVDTWVEGTHFNKPGAPFVLSFRILAKEPLDGIRAELRVFVDADTSLETVAKGHCVLWANTAMVPDARDNFINAPEGPELWLSHLEQDEVMLLAIAWLQPDPHVEYATMELESAQGSFSDIWLSEYAGWVFRERPEFEQQALFRALTLEEVCGTYSTEGLTEIDLAKG